MNVSLPPQMERYVNSLVKSGEFGSASEVVREGVRLLRARMERERTLEEIRRSVIEAVAEVDAGEWVDGDVVMEEWRQRNRAARAARGGRRRKSA